MKTHHLVGLVALALALAGCTGTDENSGDAADGGMQTTEGGGGQIEGQVTVVEGNSSTSGNETNTTNETV